MRWAVAKPKAVNQPSIFDQAERKKQQGIEAAYQGANSYWKNAAREALLECAKKYSEFASDQVWAILSKSGITTGENRAIGAIMQAASRSGMIQKTGRYRESNRVSQHRQPIAIWRSNIYLKELNLDDK